MYFVKDGGGKTVGAVKEQGRTRGEHGERALW